MPEPSITSARRFRGRCEGLVVALTTSGLNILDRRRLGTCIFGGVSLDVGLGTLLQHSNKLDGRLLRDSFFNFCKLAVEDLQLCEDAGAALAQGSCQDRDRIPA